MKNYMKWAAIGFGGLISVLAAMYGFYMWKTWPLPPPSDVPVVAGSSATLRHTQIAATLDEPLKSGHNVIWSAAFPAAWKAIQHQLTGGEPPLLAGAEQVVAALNRAPAPAASGLYAIAGRQQDGITAQIEADLKSRFPTKSPPRFSDIAADSLVAYAYLHAGLQFPIPYFQNRDAVMFNDRQGGQTPVETFGIRAEDDYAYYDLRAQARILFSTGGGLDEAAFEFAIDLCATCPAQRIVVARLLQPPATLDAALAYIARQATPPELAEPPAPDYFKSIGPNDVLLVPDIFFRLSHRFTALEGKPFTNPALQGQRLDVAQQDISFRLDRGGAEVAAEAKVYYLPIPTYFVLDGPFLVYMQEREAEMPYFVMWVENAELLRKVY